MAIQTLSLPLTIPHDKSGREACRHCIEERLGRRPGVHRVHVVPPHTDADETAIELDYDPDLVSLSQINGYLRQAGSCLHESIAHIVVPVEGIVSPRQEPSLQDMINRLPGVKSTVSYASQTIRLEFDRRLCALPEIVRMLDEVGIVLRSASKPPTAPTLHDQTPSVGLPRTHWLRVALAQHEMVMAALAGLFLVAGFIVHMTDGPQEMRLALLLASYVCGGFFPAQEMVRTLARFRLDIDLLMFAAAFGAAALGHYEEGAMLLFLFSLGGAGEELAMSRARNAIQALAKLAPRTAMLVSADGSHREVPVEDLRISDLVFVAPGQQVPADGKIANGSSAINQAPITGESVPVDKAVGDKVFAGTINGDGAITVEVGRLAADNTLAKVIRLVQEAQTTKSPTQLFTDKVEKFYVPLVIISTGLVMVVPPLLHTLGGGWASAMTPHWFPESPWKGWFYQAMAFLTAASPCALAIGTPAAVLSGIARAARGGMLVKGGVHLENLGRIEAIAFDKTGTLTHGRPKVTEIISLDPALSETELLNLAAAVERGSQHPLAQAVVGEATARGLSPRLADQISQTPGIGITGVVNGRAIRIGKLSMLPASLRGIEALRQRVDILESQGRTIVVIADDQQALGLIGLADSPREGVREMLADLRRLGIKHTIMLTGDNARTAAAVAHDVGIDEYLADLMPEDKLQRVRELDEKYRRVAMVGDGVNDAPAMANATVGIAIGGASGGSDVALETADIALLANDLRKLPEAIGVSRFARKIIIQNLVIALGVIAVLAPIAALGGTPIAIAVIFHEGSTVVVVLNSLRILRYRPPGHAAA